MGRESDIADHLQHNDGTDLSNIEVIHAPEVVGMDAKIQALKTLPDNSMNVAARLVKQDRADAIVLCGNTACSVAAAQLNLRRIRGVKRAGILAPMPTAIEGKWSWCVDCGANAEGKPEHLQQFAHLASAFVSNRSELCRCRQTNRRRAVHWL